MRTLTSVVLSCLAIMIAGCAPMPTASGTMASCSSYSSQPDAQRAWEAAGRPDASTRDRDGDDKVCESSRSGSTSVGSTTVSSKSGRDKPGCRRTDKVVDIGISKTKYPQVLQHMEEAIAEGYPRVVKVNRIGKEERRNKLLDPIRESETDPTTDLDEWPPSVGRSIVDASVKPIDSSQNRGAGSTMGLKLRQYCNGVKFRLVGF